MEKIIEALGLSWQSMLIYLANFIILAVVVIFFAFKPLRKLVDARKANMNKIITENKKLSEEAQTLKQEYQGKLHDIKQEITHIIEETTNKAEAKAEEIIQEARRHSADIVAGAEHEMEEEKQRLKNNYSQSVAELSIKIAEKILEREVNEADNKAIIDEALNKWAQ